VTRKRRRLYAVLALVAGVGIAAALVLTAFSDNLVFFHSPTEVVQKHLPAGKRFRIGGLVEAGSLKRDGLNAEFVVTDLTERVTIRYTGMLPDLFRENQGIVADGRLNEQRQFIASEVLAKHDENYMPPEVAAALKKSGQWSDKPGQHAEKYGNATGKDKYGTAGKDRAQ